ncbi:MAG TPA: o-succinylbenzoate--CoA ligase [Buttiauxella sp.]|jgi:O-succinylbenzoic acid--CoA ligase
MKFDVWPWLHWATINCAAPALRLPEGTLDWQTLCQRVDALAGGFKRQGVSEGQGVAFRAKNSAETVLCWLALLQCGARVLPLNPQLPDILLAKLLPGLSIAHVLVSESVAPVPGFTSLAVMTDDAWQVEWQPERLVSMTLTSGSSGMPKAAVHTAEAHLASAAGVLSAMSYGRDDSWLLSLPLFHVSGQGILWRWLLAGGCMAVRDLHPLSGALQGCTHASLVPTQLWRLLEQEDPITLREVLLGGAAIPVELTRAAQARGVKCWCGYGLTELASTVCAKPADGLPDVGEALPGREVKIVDEEVWIKATSLAAGYWQNGKITSLLNEQGWFSTRDRGVLNGRRLTIIGRLDNQFFSAGEGIQPEEIERVLLAHPAVTQAFVVPVDDAEFGQRPVAVVEADEHFDVATLALWVEGKLARFQQPVRWLRLPDSVRQGGIKISRKAVQLWVAGS